MTGCAVYDIIPKLETRVTVPLVGQGNENMVRFDENAEAMTRGLVGGAGLGSVALAKVDNLPYPP